MATTKDGKQVKGLTPINESSSTTSLSSEEYISSHEDDLSLDDIFDMMARAKKSNTETTKTTDETGRSKFEKLKESVENLPTIKSNSLTESLNSTTSTNTNKVQKINDPITSLLLNNASKAKSTEDKTQLKKQRSEKWFQLPKPELTKPLKQQLSILQNRQYIDPKRFYKKQKWEVPERFQIGEIMSDSVVDGSRSKLNRKQKGGDLGLLGELMNDDTSKKWFKRKYSEIQDKKMSGGKKYYKDKMAKRLKR